MSLHPSPKEALRQDPDYVTRHLGATFLKLFPADVVSEPSRYLRLILGEPHPLANLAFLENVEEPSAALAAVQPLAELPLPSCVVCREAASTETHKLLEGTGFAFSSMQGMAIETSGLSPTSLPEGYSFERAGHSLAHAWGEAATIGFELTPSMALRFSPLSHAENLSSDAELQWFVVLKEGKAVATSLLVLANGAAGIYCVTTIPDERSKGLGAYVTAEPLRHAARLGYRTGVLQATDMGLPVYRRLGFFDQGEVPMYVRIPGP